jgi:hypothetical protein
MHAVIDEAVLTRPLHSSQVMSAQLQHLLVRGEEPHITIQVVPFSAGGYGTQSGPMILVDYDDGLSGAYLEYLHGGAWVENPHNITTLSNMFDETASMFALSPDESARLIDGLMQKFNEG